MGRVQGLPKICGIHGEPRGSQSRDCQGNISICQLNAYILFESCNLSMETVASYLYIIMKSTYSRYKYVLLKRGPVDEA